MLGQKKEKIGSNLKFNTKISERVNGQGNLVNCEGSGEVTTSWKCKLTVHFFLGAHATDTKTELKFTIIMCRNHLNELEDSKALTFMYFKLTVRCVNFSHLEKIIEVSCGAYYLNPILV